VKLRGGGRQSLRLPCFYFGKNGAVMPAFGNLTGFHVIRPKKGDRVFVITENKVIAVM
jgi:metallophosphoesterase superfamily enzyme